jgi:threonine dehydrogenase-like Zn-dependent dehydrogenase
MKAFVMQEVGRAAMVDKPVPEPGPNDAIVRTSAALICPSDSHTVRGAIGDRHNLTLGHESVGVVHRLGSAVEGLQVGQRVAINAITPCTGRIDPTPMTTHRFSFAEIEKAFGMMDRKEDGIIKPLIQF